MNSDDEYVEEAEKCLNENDIACAVRYYELLQNDELKDKKLCEVTLTEAGLSLDTLLNTIKKGNSTMLSRLAKALAPWTETKSEAMEDAKVHCANFLSSATTTTNSNLAVLLNTVALLSHCSLKIAKVDLFVANSESDISCTTPGNGDGQLDSSEISDLTNGGITNAGMCSVDVTACGNDIQTIESNLLIDAGLIEIKEVFDQIQNPLKQTTSGVRALRKAIQDSF